MTAAPLCFVPPAMYQLWLSSGFTDAAECPAGVCTDCLPSYQLRMKKLGRCEHPETRFRMSAAGALFGTWQQQVAPPVRKPLVAAPAAKPSPNFWAERERQMRERMAFGR